MDKKRFIFELDNKTYRVLAKLAKVSDRSKAAVVRVLINQAASELDGKPPTLRLGAAKESRYALTG